MESIIIHGMGKPCSCIECPFLSKGYESHINKEGNMSLYVKLRRCNLAPKSLKDPWKIEDWFVNDIEPYCPIEEYKEVKNVSV